MKKAIFGAAAMLALAMPVTAAQACGGDLLGVYNTRISNRDLFASDGLRLTSVAAILQQDRANMHRFRRPDRGDQSDDMFVSAQSRALIPRWLHQVSPRAAAAIRAGNAWITVRVYEGCIDVTLA
ncbi:MAG: hypothetical protein AB7O91_07730 [Sphingomonas sp.]